MGEDDTTARNEAPEEPVEKTVVTEIIFSTEAVLTEDRRPTRDQTETEDAVVETTVIDYRHQDAGTVPSWEPTHHDVRPPENRPAAPPAAPDERHSGVGMAGQPAPEAFEPTVTRERASSSGDAPGAAMNTTPPVPPARPWLTRADKRVVIIAAVVAIALMACAYVLGYWQAAG